MLKPLPISTTPVKPKTVKPKTVKPLKCIRCGEDIVFIRAICSPCNSDLQELHNRFEYYVFKKLVYLPTRGDFYYASNKDNKFHEQFHKQQGQK